MRGQDPGNQLVTIRGSKEGCASTKQMRILVSSFNGLKRHKVLILILALYLVRGAIYASVLPPWDLVDEEQHFHYIQHIAEERKLPVLGETYISPEVVSSLFATKRWMVHHWPSPDSEDPRQMGLEGFSYEAYQPPLFYLIGAALYSLFPNDILSQLYCLRFAAVAMGAITILLTYATAAEVFPSNKFLVYGAPLIVALIPERTAAVSRVNNDVLLEVVASAAFFVLVRYVKGAMRSSLWLGFLLGLGMLTKATMLLLTPIIPLAIALKWQEGKLDSKTALKHFMLIIGLALTMSGWFFWRNICLYGELTGTRSFIELAGFKPIPFNPALLFDLYKNFWVVWWEGASVRRSIILDAFYILFGIISCLAGYGGVKYLIKGRLSNWRGQILLISYLSIILSALGTFYMSLMGLVPVIQGRFMIPSIVPIALSFIWGLATAVPPRFHKALLIPIVLALFLIDALYVFSHLLPYFYFWSVVA